MNPLDIQTLGASLTPDPLDTQLARLVSMKDSLTDLGRNLDKIIAQRDDLLHLVADLRKENASLREALERCGRRN